MEKDRMLKAYNKEIKNWNFEKEQLSEFLRILTEKNQFICEQTPLIDFYPSYKTSSKNEAVINHNKIVDLQHIGFHVGFPHQKRLYSLINEDTNVPNNTGIFFSLRSNDVIYFSDFDNDSDTMVYFLDLTFANGLRIQTDYASSVISRYDLDELIEMHHSENKPFLTKKHRQLNERWIKKNTVSFVFDKIKDFKQKGYDWLIVADPIDVKY